MKKQDIQTKIDNYLLNRMTLEERQDFETEILTDTQLKDTVDLQRLLVTEIQQRAFISEIIVETEKRMEEEGTINGSIPFQQPIPDVAACIPPVAADKLPSAASRTFTLRQIMLVSWSAAAIFIGVFFVNNIVQNSRMDNLYTVNYSMPQANDTRGDNPIEQAAKILGNDQPKQAKIILESIYNNNSISVDIEEVRWYLALTELKLHNKSNAKKYLNELKVSSKYGKKAEDILKKL